MSFNSEATGEKLTAASSTLATEPVYDVTPTMQPTMPEVDLSGIASASTASIEVVFLSITIALLIAVLVILKKIVKMVAAGKETGIPANFVVDPFGGARGEKGSPEMEMVDTLVRGIARLRHPQNTTPWSRRGEMVE